MKLKYQLLLLGLLSLLLPLTGWFALKSVDQEFRRNIDQAAKSTLISLQASVQQIVQKDAEYQLDGLVLGKLEQLIVDGYANEWEKIVNYAYKANELKLEVKLAEVNGNLALFITSNDKTVDINPANLTENDYIMIGLVNQRGIISHYKFYRQAEGKIKAQNSTTQGPTHSSYWHETANGYTVEILFNNDESHHLGFANVDYNEVNDNLHNSVTGTLQTNNQSLKLLPIISKNEQLKKFITKITPQNNQFSIKDSENRVIFTVDKLPLSQKASAWQWLITPVYQWLFGIDNNNNSNWFYRPSDGMTGVSQTLIDENISYHLKSMMPQGQQNMIQTILKASLMMIVIVVLIMLAYLLYSLILAWRIKTLNHALQTVLDDSGTMHIQMPAHNAKDEIGQLSRGIQTMLLEMREYTQYLKDLGARLSHEMKTPLAIVQTSLDNFEQEQNSEFLTRAKHGSKRLKFILNQLSELSQLKYSLESTPKQLFDLTKLCQQLGDSYQSYIPNVQLDISSNKILIHGSEDLIAQLIDKLMENAEDFTPEDGCIELKLFANNKNITIMVSNTGSQLPEPEQLNIFGSLTSMRVKKSGTPNTAHLGLGLYVVQLIARYHNGSVAAKNIKQSNKVEFTVTFINN
ncbi:MAG: ATP-binding protein [Proteobacteria bacterium]|nr:ATP-binding protein [Pseudomonadota bacterium]